MMASEECSYLSFRGLRPFFGVRKDTHVLFFREKRRAKGWWLCKSVDTCFSPSFHLLFSFHPLYLHATAQPFASARFLFSEKKEKPKENGGGGVYVSALSLLFRLLFSFLPLYLHTAAQPFFFYVSSPAGVQTSPGERDFVPVGLRKRVFDPLFFFREKRKTKRQMTSRWHRYLLFRRLCFFFFIPFASAASSAREIDFDPLFFFRGKRRTKRG